MMDRLQDGLVNMLKKKNPDLKVPNNITKQRRKTTVLIEKSWMREYSSVNMELIHNKSIISRQTSKSKLADSDYVSMSTPTKADGVSLGTIEGTLMLKPHLFENAHKLDFDIFDFTNKLGRKHGMTNLMMHLLRQLPG